MIRACRANGARYAALTMTDHIYPDLRNKTGSLSESDLPPQIAEISALLCQVGVRLSLLGTGPSSMLTVTP